MQPNEVVARPAYLGTLVVLKLCNKQSTGNDFNNFSLYFADITLRACKQAPSDYPLPIVIGHDLLDFSSNISTLQAPVDKCGLIAYSFYETVFAMTRGGYCVIGRI